MARTDIQNLTRRALVAMLTAVPAAAVLGAVPERASLPRDPDRFRYFYPEPPARIPTNVEKLEAYMRQHGIVQIVPDWGPKAAAMTQEERAGVLLDSLVRTEKHRMLDFRDSYRTADLGAPRCKRAPIDVRELVKSL